MTAIHRIPHNHTGGTTPMTPTTNPLTCPPITGRVVRCLAQLAAATSDYESSWRTAVTAEDAVTRREAYSALTGHASEQVSARNTLIRDGIPANLVHAIEGALVVAAARVDGDRPAKHRDGAPHFATTPDVAGFIHETIREGGIV
jgi:hypothetical protein